MRIQNLLGISELDENIDPFECADYLKHIIINKYLSPKLVSNNIQEFYLSHRGFVPKMGSLGIRFTVQFNLFLGSINALANEKQKRKVFLKNLFRYFLVINMGN